MKGELIFNHIRIQLLSQDIFRIEYHAEGEFWDKSTFFIPNREQFEGVEADEVLQTENGHEIVLGNYRLFVPAKSRSLKGVKLTDADGNLMYTYKRLKNTGELPALSKTPEVFPLSDTPRIYVPDGGYTLREGMENDGYILEENVEDVYLLLARKDAKLLRRLYVKLTGKSELVRLATLGAWQSRYFAYNEQSAKDMIDEFRRRRIPLDNFVVDTDWRKSSATGIGYDINTELFPDMEGFISYAHNENVEIMFNDHPEPVKEAKDILDPIEVAYREEKLQSLMEIGLDTWWYDRNWHTVLKSPTEDIRPETWGFHAFHSITENFYKEHAKGQYPFRPVMMGNVNNIAHGFYDKIGDSASHRYSIQWTGDIYSDTASLRREIGLLLRAGNSLIGYVNSDCGGHVGNPDKYLYLRWIQFGVLSPVFRPHSCNNVKRFREPWQYDEETVEIARNYYNLRYHLLPLIYTCAWQNYKEGLPIFKALGYEYPTDKKALKTEDAYLLGNNLLIAPIYDDNEVGNETGALQYDRKFYLPQGKWMDLFDGKQYSGGRTYHKVYDYKTMPLFVRLGGLIPLAHSAQSTAEQNWDQLVYDYYPSKDAAEEGYLYEDDTRTVAYKHGEYRTSAYEAGYAAEQNCIRITIHASQGRFAGKKCVENREITLRYHLLPGAERVTKVCLNGKEITYKVVKKNKTAFPLNTDGAVCDSSVLIVCFTTNVSEDVTLEFILD